MAPNETTVLLTNYREKRNLSSSRNGYGGDSNADIGDSSHHIVEINKDPADYQPIFSIDDYSSALNLAELLPFQDDPWWQRFRRILFLSFWLTLIMTFITACILSYVRADQLSCQVTDSNLISTPLDGATTRSSLLLPASTIANLVPSELLDKSRLLSQVP